METYLTLDSFLNNLLTNHSREKIQQEDKQIDSLENLLEEKVNSLSDILKQIEQDIERRNDLSRKVIFQIYEHYSSIKSKLFQLEFWELGSNRGIDSTRSGLGKQLDVLKQEVRKEQIQHWFDISKLKKESRNWFKQYRDLVQRVRLVNEYRSPQEQSVKRE